MTANLTHPATTPFREPEAFGLWLSRGLHTTYGGVMWEPVPDEMLALLASLAPEH